MPIYPYIDNNVIKEYLYELVGDEKKIQQLEMITIIDYNNIVIHEKKYCPKLKNIELYKLYCKNREILYKNTVLDYIFD